MSSVITIRLNDELKEQLEFLAKSTQRTKSFLAAEAIKDYVKINEWQIKEIELALQEANQNNFIKKALKNLDDELEFIAKESPERAKQVFKQIGEHIQLLENNPSLGREGRIVGTRELVVTKTKYIIPYRVKNSRIEILRIFHTARRLPKNW